MNKKLTITDESLKELLSRCVIDSDVNHVGIDYDNILTGELLYAYKWFDGSAQEVKIHFNKKQVELTNAQKEMVYDFMYNRISFDEEEEFNNDYDCVSTLKEMFQHAFTERI